jgi:hypothetical protein
MDNDATQSNINIELQNDNSMDNASVIINLQSLIKNHISNIDRLKIEVKKKKEMLDDVFLNNQTYKLHDQKVKEANKLKLQTKAEILKNSSVADLNSKIKDMKTDLKELESALSEYLAEYARLSGVNEIEGEDGEVREIIYIAKLIKKQKK